MKQILIIATILLPFCLFGQVNHGNKVVERNGNLMVLDNAIMQNKIGTGGALDSLQLRRNATAAPSILGAAANGTYQQKPLSFLPFLGKNGAGTAWDAATLPIASLPDGSGVMTGVARKDASGNLVYGTVGALGVELGLGNMWNTNGNVVTNTNFIGTTNLMPINFKTNNTFQGKIDEKGILSGVNSFGINYLNNSYFNRPLNIYTDAGVSVTKAHPYTAGFEFPYTPTAPVPIAANVDVATQAVPYWTAAYNMGLRSGRGGLSGGWGAIGDGNILKISSTNTPTAMGRVFIPTDIGAKGVLWVFKCWVKILKGQSFSVGSDAGVNGNEVNVVSSSIIQAGQDGWYLYTAKITTSYISTLNSIAVTLYVKPSVANETEAYIALPYLSPLYLAEPSAEAWQSSFQDKLARNNIYIDGTKVSILGEPLSGVPNNSLSIQNLQIDNTATKLAAFTANNTIVYRDAAINTSTNLTGNGFTTPLDLANTGIAAGTYTAPTLTIDAKGRVTSAVSGSNAYLPLSSTANQTLAYGNNLLSLNGNLKVTSTAPSGDVNTLSVDNSGFNTTSTFGTETTKINQTPSNITLISQNNSYMSVDNIGAYLYSWNNSKIGAAANGDLHIYTQNYLNGFKDMYGSPLYARTHTLTLAGIGGKLDYIRRSNKALPIIPTTTSPYTFGEDDVVITKYLSPIIPFEVILPPAEHGRIVDIVNEAGQAFSSQWRLTAPSGSQFQELGGTMVSTFLLSGRRSFICDGTNWYLRY